MIRLNKTPQPNTARNTLEGARHVDTSLHMQSKGESFVRDSCEWIYVGLLLGDAILMTRLKRGICIVSLAWELVTFLAVEDESKI